MPDQTGSTQRSTPVPPAITRHAQGSPAAPVRAVLAPPFLRGRSQQPAEPPMPVAAPAPAYELSADEAERIAQHLDQLAQQVRSRQLPGITSVQGPEDIAGLLIAAITDHVGRGN